MTIADLDNSSSNPRLLVVDDETATLKLVKAILVKSHYEVVTSTTVENALKILDEQPFDCVITDAVMPGLSGYDLVKTIREEPLYGELPVLMLTRKRHRQDVKKAVEAGVTDYVLKPLDEQLLLDKVELCLKKGGGKRHVFEYAVQGEESKATLTTNCKITSISESECTGNLPISVTHDMQIDLNGVLFQSIGIPPPLLKLVSCRQVVFNNHKDSSFEAKFSFIGVPESELKKIRTWLHREEIRRRKQEL